MPLRADNFFQGLQQKRKLFLQYRSKRPISSNHSSLYLAHNTITSYSSYSIDRSARYLPLIVHCIWPTIPLRFTHISPYLAHNMITFLLVLQYRSKRPISFRHSVVFSPHYDYVLLVLRYRSKRPISYNHNSLYSAHNTITVYFSYGID